MRRSPDKKKPSKSLLQAVKSDPEPTSEGEPELDTRSLRNERLPKPPGDKPATFDFAMERDGVERRHQVVLDVERMKDTDAFDRIMQPALDIAEARRQAPRPGEKGKRNKPGDYTVHELWFIEAAARAMGLNTHRKVQRWLTSDDAIPFLRRFGFLAPRLGRCGGRPQVDSTPGIPSRNTLARYRNDWFIFDENHSAWMAYERAVQFEVIEVDPEGVKAESAVLMADGSAMETNHTVPIFKKKLKPGQKRDPSERPANEFKKHRKTGELVPNIHCPEGGFIAGGSDHAGQGFNFVPVMDRGANIVSWRLDSLAEPENEALYNQREEVAAWLRRVGVDIAILSTDNAFNSSAENGMPRGAWHDINVIENIQLSSHGDSEKTKASAQKRRDQKLTIAWNPKFWLDGHRQGNCEHGLCRRVRNTDDRARRRGLIIRTEWVCPCPDKSENCGSVTLTAGKYRLAFNGKSIVKARKDEKQAVDWMIGTFMTYDDPDYTKKFGMLRRSMQEGFFGSQLTNRLGVLEKRRIRQKAQAERDMAISLSILHAAKLAHRRKRLGTPRAQASPTAVVVEGAPAEPPLAVAA